MIRSSNSHPLSARQTPHSTSTPGLHSYPDQSGRTKSLSSSPPHDTTSVIRLLAQCNLTVYSSARSGGFATVLIMKLMNMQQATHPRLHVRDAHDAHIVFEAVRQGFLRPITRRLNDMERNTIVRSGAVFVWVECDDDAGLKRWTDGRIWGQSRMRDPYLFYDEKLPFDPSEGSYDTANRSPTYRFVDSAPRNGPTSSALSHQDRMSHQHPGLVKQAYSAWVSSNPCLKPQKWHLTAYFTYAELSLLPTIDREPLLRKIIVPSGIYRTGYARSKSDEDRLPAGHSADEQIPSLNALQLMAGSYDDSRQHYNSRGSRLPEDQRMIRMLNSRHIM